MGEAAGSRIHVWIGVTCLLAAAGLAVAILMARASEPESATDTTPSPSATAAPTPVPTQAGTSLTFGLCREPSDGRSVARVWNEAALDAIRLDSPAPTVHSRNLYHLSAAMWDAWAAFDPGAEGLFVDQSATAADVDSARADAMSVAAALLLSERYRDSVGSDETLSSLDTTFQELCGRDLETVVDELEPDSAGLLGASIADLVLAAGADDGANEENNYEDPTYAPVNPPLKVAFTGTELADPNRWQPLDLDVAFSQNGLPEPDGPQVFIGSQWGAVTPFALQSTSDGLPIDPDPPPLLESGTDSIGYRRAVVHVLEASSLLQVGETKIDIGPGAVGNNPLGSDTGDGHDLNPVTGERYSPTIVDAGDYYRAIAEFWADGPDSETPPGHWNKIANDVSDSLEPDELRIASTGDAVSRLEWDTKLYLVLNGAMHDAAIAAWGAKAHYDYVRPISMVRYMGGLGQSSDPDLPAYHPDGLPLIPGLIEVITQENTAPGAPHETRPTFVGNVMVNTWKGPPADPQTETAGVGWIRAISWVPYQRPTFVTPAFAAYVSGHSTFSRAGADVLENFTGSAYFPGGIGEFTVEAGALVHESGPSNDVTLQWATYADAADEAGRSRIYGGIHIPEDDIAGRLMGAECALRAWERATALF